jgi:uncharacterized membrane protein
MASKRQRNRQAEKPPAHLPPGAISAAPEAGHPPTSQPGTKRVTTTLRVQEQLYQGPIPSPDILRGFDVIVPGSADRIIAMAEQQSAHRIAMEAKALHHEIVRSYCGLAAGFVISLIAIVGGLLLSYSGQPWAGTTIATVGLASLAGVFVYGTRSVRSERLEKAKIMTGQTETKSGPPSTSST